MALNKLYKYINSVHFRSIQKNNILNPKGFTKPQMDTSKTFYVMYPFNQLKKSALKKITERGYRMVEHHVSVYETQNSKNEYLSEYHYTATFDGPDGLNYKLHVYFDEKGELTTPPRFFINQEPFETQNIDKDFSDEFKSLAEQATAALMREIKTNQHAFLTNLEENYKKLEGEMRVLSKDLNHNRDLYLKKREEIIKVLNDLIEYHSDPQYITLHNLISNIDLPKLDEPVEVTEEENEPENKNQAPFVRQPYTSPDMMTKSKKDAEELKLQNLIKSADQKCKIYAAVKDKCDYKQKLTSFLTLDTDVSSLIILDKKENKTIKSISTQRENFALELVEGLLLNNQFELVLKLQKFLQTHAEYWVKKALGQGNAKALEFIITTTKINIQSVLIDGLSPIVYCFNQDNDKTPLAECLSVLIAHGGSFMTPVKEGGLSVAHHVLKKPNHPLVKAFFDNKDKTIASRKFWKKLSEEIKIYPGELGLDANETDLLTVQKEFLNCSENPSLFICPPLKKLHQLVEEWIQAEIEPEMREPLLKLLKEERFYLLKCHEYDQVSQEHAERLAMKFPRQCRDIVQRLQELPKFKFPIDKKMCAQELKEVLRDKIKAQVVKLRGATDLLNSNLSEVTLLKCHEILLDLPAKCDLENLANCNDDLKSKQNEACVLKQDETEGSNEDKASTTQVCQVLNWMREDQEEKAQKEKNESRKPKLEKPLFELFSEKLAERRLNKKSSKQNENVPPKPLTVENISKSFDAFFAKRMGVFSDEIIQERLEELNKDSIKKKPYDKPKKRLPTIWEEPEEELPPNLKNIIPELVNKTKTKTNRKK